MRRPEFMCVLHARPFFRTQVAGTFLNASSVMDDVTVTVAGQPCPYLADQPFNPDGSIWRLDCSVPPLPWGEYTVEVMVAGRGLARAPLTFFKALPTLFYNLSTLAQRTPALGSDSQCRLGMWGGGLLTFSGIGLVEGSIVNPALNRSMQAIWETTASDFCTNVAGATVLCTGAAPSPAAVAAAGGRLGLQLSGASNRVTTMRLARYTVANPELYNGKATARTRLRWNVRVTNTTTNAAAVSTSPQVRAQASHGRGHVSAFAAGAMMQFCATCVQQLIQLHFTYLHAVSHMLSPAPCFMHAFWISTPYCCQPAQAHTLPWWWSWPVPPAVRGGLCRPRTVHLGNRHQLVPADAFVQLQRLGQQQRPGRRCGCQRERGDRRAGGCGRRVPLRFSHRRQQRSEQHRLQRDADLQPAARAARQHVHHLVRQSRAQGRCHLKPCALIWAQHGLALLA